MAGTKTLTTPGKTHGFWELFNILYLGAQDVDWQSSHVEGQM